MKLTKKIVAGLTVTVLALSMMVGTAMGREKHDLPFNYPVEADAATDNDVWVKLIGGGTVISDKETAELVRSVDIHITGNATFDAELIYNFQGGWNPTVLGGQSVDGQLVLTMPMNGKGSDWVEVVVNLQNKSEGPLAVVAMEFKDADGNVVLTHGTVPGAEAPAETPAETPAAPVTDSKSAPKTGVASMAIIFGLGAAAFGTGAVVLKKRD